jgi:chemotaxis signal transduction protein
MESSSRNTSKSASTATAREASVLRTGLCLFWLGGRLFGIDVSLVGEVVTVEHVLPVPMAPAGVRGLFNLRGAPIVLLDCTEVLRIEEKALVTGTITALVIRTESLAAALLVDRMEAVLGTEQGVTNRPTTEEHPAVAYFLRVPGGGTATVIDPQYLLTRLNAFRFTKEVE